jgi:hypothetical protein
MSDTHNVFISRRYEDDALASSFKEPPRGEGENGRNPSINSDTLNNAKNVDNLETPRLSRPVDDLAKVDSDTRRFADELQRMVRGEEQGESQG